MAVGLTLNRHRQVPAEETPAFGSIAERFRRAGQLDRAVSLCLDGLKRFPDHVSARVTLGWSLMDLGRYEEARHELEQVLKRAPDNLAAIRGLAELHDRAEHTMMLPMDGPGQWPPNEETVESATAPTASSTSEIELPEIEYPAVELPAEELPAVDLTPAAAVASEERPAAWAQQAEAPNAPAFEVAAAFEAAAPVAAVDADIDEDHLRAAELSLASALVAEPEDAEAPATVVLAADEGFTVPEADIQALLAEADSLEAAAEVEAPESVILAAAETAAVSLDATEATAAIDEGVPFLNSEDDGLMVAAAQSTELASEPVQLSSEDVVEFVGTAEQAPEVEVPAVAALAEVELAAVEASTFTEGAPEVEVPAAATLADVELVAIEASTFTEEAPEAEVPAVAALADVEPVALEASTFTEEEPEAEVPPVAALAEVEPAAADEPFTTEIGAISLVHAFETAEAADDAVSVPAVMQAVPARSPVAALERFLSRVQARRTQLMAESVA